MKDNKFVNTDSNDIEKILKSKMNELSDSVDCFDRISAQVFKEDKFGFSDNGFTVSGLENVTGKSKAPRFLKWTAVAAAAAFCITLIPRNNSVRHFFHNSNENYFPAIIEELNTELESGQYAINEVPLEFYLENDILVTPLFSCPFENCGKEDAKVRLFTKQIDGIDTTQMYAVLYSGTYTESNFIAAAESKFKFTDVDEAVTFADTSDYPHTAESALIASSSPSDNGKFLLNNGFEYSIASFTNTTVMKQAKKGLTKNVTEIIFGSDGESEYFYDIYCNEGEIPDRNKMWANSVYYNGNSSFAKENKSLFKKTDIFINLSKSYVSNSNITSVYAFDPDLSDSFLDSYSDNDTMKLTTVDNGTLISSIQIPFDIEALCTAKVYFESSAFDSSESIRTSSNKYGTKTLYSEDDTNLSDDEKQNLYQNRIKIAKLLKQKKSDVLKNTDEIEKEKLMREAEEINAQQRYESELQQKLEKEYENMKQQKMESGY